jgi:hypothetical protein
MACAARAEGESPRERASTGKKPGPTRPSSGTEIPIFAPVASGGRFFASVLPSKPIGDRANPFDPLDSLAMRGSHIGSLQKSSAIAVLNDRMITRFPCGVSMTA